MENKFDVIIIGGGMVGAAAAVSFAKQNKRVALIENHVPKRESLELPPLRVSAVNLYSEAFLTQCGIWANIEESASNQFKRLATWEKRHQVLMFNSEEIDRAHLGHLIRNEALQQAAFDTFTQFGDLIQVCSDEVSSIEQDSQQVRVQLGEQQLLARLLIGADGAQSVTRRMMKVGQTGWQYQQSCLSITIKAEDFEQDITWQEFQESGPKAFLPLTNNHHALIWYDNKQRVKELSQLDDAQLKQEIIATFPPLPGDFDIVQHASFPLARTQANQYVKGNIVLVGDAAHTINPLAGQGVNLGYKDVSVLSDLLKDIDWQSEAAFDKALREYQLKCKAQSLLMSSMMDAFYLLFSNQNSVLASIRQTALQLAGSANVAKKWVLNKAVGY